MTKNLIVALILAFIVMAFSAQTVRADEVVCVQNYGQPTVCGVEHTPVKTGIGDVNVKLLGIGLLGASFASFIVSKKKHSANF